MILHFLLKIFKFYYNWPNESTENDHTKLFEFLYNECGCSKEFLLMNANYLEYSNRGLEGFEVIQAILHFLQQNSFMSREIGQINYSLSI